MEIRDKLTGRKEVVSRGTLYCLCRFHSKIARFVYNKIKKGR